MKVKVYFFSWLFGLKYGEVNSSNTSFCLLANCCSFEWISHDMAQDYLFSSVIASISIRMSFSTLEWLLACWCVLLFIEWSLTIHRHICVYSFLHLFPQQKKTGVVRMGKRGGFRRFWKYSFLKNRSQENIYIWTWENNAIVTWKLKQ